MTDALRGQTLAPLLFGRTPSLEKILQAFNSIRSDGSAFVVSGRAGMGATSVLESAAMHAQHAGFSTTTAKARRAERERPLAGVHRVLRQTLRLLPTDRHVDRVQRLLTDPVSPIVLAEGAAGVLTEAGRRRPIVIVVDDGHLLDETSRQVLSSMCRMLSGSAVMMVIAARSGRSKFPAFDVLDLEPVWQEVAEEIVDACGVHLPTSLRSRILSEANGNAMALMDLPGANCKLTGPGAELFVPFLSTTARMQRSLGVDLDDLDGDTRAALLAAALDPGARMEDILVAAGLMRGHDLGNEVLEPALDRQLICADDQIRFQDAMLPTVLVNLANLGEVREAHAALELALAHQPHRATVHAAHAMDHVDEAVAARLERSAWWSGRHGEPRDALQRLEHAARLSPSTSSRARRLVSAGRAAYELGRPDVGGALLARAEHLDCGPGLSGAIEAIRARFAAQVTWSGVPVGDRSALAAHLHRTGDVEVALDLLPAIAQSLLWSELSPDARTAIDLCLQQMSTSRSDPRLLALLSMISPVRAAGLVSNAAIDERDAEACRLMAVAHLALGDFPRAVDLLALAANRLRAGGQLGLLAQVTALHGHIVLGLGDWDLAESALVEAVRLAGDTRQPLWQLRASAALAAVHALRGDSRRAVAEAIDVERRTLGRPLGSILASTRFARAMALVSEQRWSDAFHVLAPLFDSEEPAYHRSSAARLIGYLAETALHADEVPHARQVIQRFRAASDPSPLLEVNMAFVDAVLADDPSAERCFAVARDIASLRWPWTRARLDLAHGMWLRRQRRVAESRVVTARAGEVFDLLGAVAWSHLARTELRAAGVDAPMTSDQPHTYTPLQELSPQEMQIATLAASGLSNREIGERLYLSPRTVGSHLYRLFPKLGITSRVQLAHKLRAD